MSFPHRLKMTVCFAIYFLVGYLVRGTLMGQGLTLPLVVRGLTLGLVIFFVWFNTVTAPLWNRRARRLDFTNKSHQTGKGP